MKVHKMPNNLPLNWCMKSFKDSFVSFSPTYKIKQKEYKDSGSYPIIDQGESFIGGYTDSTEGLIYDVPLIAFGDHTRRFKYIDFPFIAGADGLKVYKPIYTEIKFSYYQCLSLDFPNRGYSRHNAFLQKCDFKIPPFAEQERIVEKIEALFQDIDEGVERLKSAQAQIKQYRQSVLKSAFEGKLYKTTEWKEKKLKDVCTSITDGDHQAPPKAIKGIPFIMISDIRDHKINLYTNNFVKEDYYNNISENRKAHKGDILYSVVGSYGIATLVNITDKFCFQRHIALIKVNIKNITSPFLYHLMNSNNIYKQATICSTGTAQKTVPLSGLRNFSFLLPTLPEQQRIVEEIEKRFAVADELEKAVNEGLEKADKLKQSILKKAFEGKLAPQNPNDEPASVLLERIKKSQTPTKGKKK